MATIKEVAALARVTPTTVTNVLRGRGRVGQETRERVLAAAHHAGYRPNLTARALVEGKAPTLALMLSCITNPFYPEFTLHAHRAARKRERFLLVCNTDYEADGGQQFLDEVGGSLSDGVLVANRGGLDLQQLQTARARGTPVVICIWEHPESPPGLPCVAFDSRHAGRIATEHLVALGHRRIGAIVASPQGGIHGGRYDGYRDVLLAAGLRHTPADLRFCEDSYLGGYQAAREMLAGAHDFSALFVSNDLPALGVLNAAADLGIAVPRQLSVVSITDIELASQSRPALTTVAIPTAEMATLGIEMLLQLLDGEPDPPPMVCVPTLSLVTRESTAPPLASTPP